MKIEECIRCRSKDVITCMVNTRITLNGEKTKAFGVESQKKYEPTDAVICRECGHIEFILDWDKVYIS